MGVLNLLYKVGSRNESSELTGFAHLFEHLMFGGSDHAPDFDTWVQNASGENNAFTSPDITNYYISLPVQNIETAFWLESDRMVNLTLNQQVLDVQKKVVIEEYNQRYVNQPYGNAWMKLRELFYQSHPYRWPTIGADMDHIRYATLDHVQAFYKKHYAPDNAILVSAGNFSFEKAKELTEKWFGTLPSTGGVKSQLPTETFDKSVILSVEESVPLEALYIAFPMVKRNDPLYYAWDLLSDLLGGSKSGFLYRKLVKEDPVFSEFSCFVSGDADPGMFVIEGKCLPGFTPEMAKEKIKTILTENQQSLTERDLTRVKNRVVSILSMSELNLLNKAMNLAYAEFLEDASMIHSEEEKYQAVTLSTINHLWDQLINGPSATLFYHKKA